MALNSQGAMRTFRAPPMLNNHFVHNSNTNGSVIVSKAVTYPDQQVRATWLHSEDRAQTDRKKIAKTYDSRLNALHRLIVIFAPIMNDLICVNTTSSCDSKSNTLGVDINLVCSNQNLSHLNRSPHFARSSWLAHERQDV